MEVSQTVKCPECGSESVFKDGLRYPREGSPIQRFLCRICGFRFSERNVKPDISSQILKVLNSRKNNHKQRIITLDSSFQKTSDDLFFLNGEDSGIHSLTSVEKRLNSLPYSNSNHQIGASDKKKAKNLAIATENVNGAIGEEKTHGETKGKIVEFLFSHGKGKQKP